MAAPAAAALPRAYIRCAQHPNPTLSRHAGARLSGLAPGGATGELDAGRDGHYAIHADYITPFTRQRMGEFYDEVVDATATLECIV